MGIVTGYGQKMIDSYARRAYERWTAACKDALSASIIRLTIFHIDIGCDCGRPENAMHRPTCASSPIYREMVKDLGNPWLIYKEFPLF